MKLDTLNTFSDKIILTHNIKQNRTLQNYLTLYSINSDLWFDQIRSKGIIGKQCVSCKCNPAFNSSAPTSKQTTFVIDIYSKSEDCVEKYLMKLCLD